MRPSTRSPFPVGLYAALLGALVLLARPHWTATVESSFAAVQNVPLRAWVHVEKQRRGVTRRTADVERAARAVAQLRARQDRELAEARPSGIPGHLVAIPCRVVERVTAGPRAQRATTLVLDRTVDELDGCVAYVTHGDALLGFLDARAPRGGPARVQLLAHRERRRLPRRVPARVRLDDGATLGFLVEPAAAIDRWPLRCALLDDPYLAARIDREEYVVRTFDPLRGGDPLGAVPAGLRVGWLRIWGYRSADRVLPIGLFVEPAVDADLVTTLAVWRPAQGRRGDGDSAALPALRRRSVTLAGLPATRGSGTARWLATTDLLGNALPAGAAAVAGQAFVGVVQAAGRGYALVTAFGEPGAVWPVVLLPDDPAREPLALLARCVGRSGDDVVVDVRDAAADAPGELFTGTVGRHCPSGLWIGSAVPYGEPGSGRFRVRLPNAAGRDVVVLERPRRATSEETP